MSTNLQFDNSILSMLSTSSISGFDENVFKINGLGSSETAQNFEQLIREHLNLTEIKTVPNDSFAAQSEKNTIIEQLAELYSEFAPEDWQDQAGKFMPIDLKELKDLITSDLTEEESNRLVSKLRQSLKEGGEIDNEWSLGVELKALLQKREQISELKNIHPNLVQDIDRQTLSKNEIERSGKSKFIQGNGVGPVKIGDKAEKSASNKLSLAVADGGKNGSAANKDSEVPINSLEGLNKRGKEFVGKELSIEDSLVDMTKKGRLSLSKSDSFEVGSQNGMSSLKFGKFDNLKLNQDTVLNSELKTSGDQQLTKNIALSMQDNKGASLIKQSEIVDASQNHQSKVPANDIRFDAESAKVDLTQELKSSSRSEFTQGLNIRNRFAPNLSVRIQWMLRQSLSSAEIMMDPPELGPMTVKVQQTNGETSIFFQVNHLNTKEALDNNLAKLKEMLNQQGLNIADAQVEQNDKQASSEEENNKSQTANKIAQESVDENTSDTQNLVLESKLDGLVDVYS